MTESARAPAPDLPLLVAWEEFLGWLFPVVEKIPKAHRFTVASRIQALALDVLDALVEARYRREKLDRLASASLALEQLRALLRLAHGLRLIAPAAYRQASERIDAAGRMLGGWMKSQGRREQVPCGA